MSEFSEETGFDGYEPESVDPGSLVLVATIVFCLLSLASVPCLISLHKRCGRQRGANDGSSRQDRSRTCSANENESPPERAQNKVPEEAPSVHPRLPSDDESVESNASSVAQNFLNVILDGNPRSGPNPRRTRANMTKYHQQLRVQDSSQDFEPEPVVVNDNQSTKNKCDLRKLNQDEASRKDQAQEVNSQHHTSCFRSPARAFDGLLEIVEWDYEMKRICRLATPFVMRDLAGGVLEAVNVAVIARFIGTSEVAAYVTADMVVGLSSSLFCGFTESLATLCSQAIGAGNKTLAGQYVQISMVLFVVCFSPFIVFWMLYMEETLRWFGFDEYTVKVGTDFSRIFVFVELIESISESLHALLDTIGKESYSGIFGTLGEAAATAGVLTVALRKDSSLERVGLVYLFVAAGELFLNVLIISWKGWFDDYLGGLIGGCALRHGKTIRLMFKTAASLSLGYLLSYSEWEILALFAQTLGPAEVAAWGLLGTLWDIVEMVSEASADAAEVRCATLLGSGRPDKAKRSAYKSIYLTLFISLFISSCVLIVGDDLPTWITKDATLQRMLSNLIPLFGIGNIALTLGTIAWTIVGSQGRYRLSTAVGFAGSWFVTMPLAALSTIALNVDLQGQTAAVVVGYMVSGTVNSYLLFTSDWEMLSREVIEANAEISSSSSSWSSRSDGESISSQSASNDVDTAGCRVQVTELDGTELADVHREN